MGHVVEFGIVLRHLVDWWDPSLRLVLLEIVILEQESLLPVVEFGIMVHHLVDQWYLSLRLMVLQIGALGQES